MAYYNLKCGAEFERCDVTLMEEHVSGCTICQQYLSGMKANSVSVVDIPVDPNCKTSDGNFLAVEWVRK